MLGEPSLSGGHDLALATATAMQRLEAGFDLGHPPVALDQFGRNAPENLKDSLGTHSAEMLVAARDEARRIVDHNVAAIAAFAETLAEANELTGEDLTAAIEAAGFRDPNANVE
ncbi:MAG: hypothetical protein ABJC39_11995 [Chloroflexota bacterium]